MRLKMMTSLMTVGLVAGLGTLTACENRGVYEDPNEGLYEEQELYEENEGLYEEKAGTSTLTFEEFDANDDGWISEQEFTAMYNQWDANRDGRLTEDEFGF